MIPLDKLIGLIAPHRCLACGQTGRLLCESCIQIAFINPPSRCYLCHKATKQSQVCENCRRHSPLKHVWVATEYDDIPKKLVFKLKFGRAAAAASILAAEINEILPHLPGNVIVAHVPTAQKRVRVRGYDQSKLIAKSLASQRKWRYVELLQRRGSTRQVGASRKVRLSQLQGAFVAQNKHQVRGAHILLIDDIVTTGATLEAAAKVLKKAGAKTIDAAVFAQPIE